VLAVEMVAACSSWCLCKERGGLQGTAAAAVCSLLGVGSGPHTQFCHAAVVERQQMYCSMHLRVRASGEQQCRSNCLGCAAACTLPCAAPAAVVLGLEVGLPGSWGSCAAAVAACVVSTLCYAAYVAAVLLLARWRRNEAAGERVFPAQPQQLLRTVVPAAVVSVAAGARAAFATACAAAH
jgi:hypothetical protein